MKGGVLILMLIGLPYRVLSLATIAEVAPCLTPLAVGTTVLATLLLSADDLQWATVTDGSHILGSIASLFAPCFKKDELSHFFANSNLTALALISVWRVILAWLLQFDDMFVNRNPDNFPSKHVCFQSSSMPQNETDLFCPAAYFQEFGPIENCTRSKSLELFVGFPHGFIHFCTAGPELFWLLLPCIYSATYCLFVIFMMSFVYRDQRSRRNLDRNLWDSI